MPKKSSSGSFTTSLEFISVLTGVVTIVSLIVGLVQPTYLIYLIIPSALLMFLTYIRYRLGIELKLIEEYKLLMNYLRGLVDLTEAASRKGLVNPNNDICIWQVVSNPKNKESMPHCWQYYFYDKGIDLHNRFHELDGELDKLISMPYLLKFKSRYHNSKNRLFKFKITEQFNLLVVAYQDQYKKYKEMLDTLNADKTSFNYDKIEKAYADFKSALERSGKDFEEMQDLSTIL